MVLELRSFERERKREKGKKRIRESILNFLRAGGTVGSHLANIQ